MLDTILSKPMISLNLPSKSSNNKSNAIVLSGCKVTLMNEKPYSEQDEENQYFLNNNDYENDFVIIDLYFDNNFTNPYSEYKIQCVSVRADRNIICKINKNPSDKLFGYKTNCKVTKDGKVGISIGYYFTSEQQKNDLLNCNTFCIEGFVSFEKDTNVYGFVCYIEKVNDEWIFCEGNTYKKKANINNLYH